MNGADRLRLDGVPWWPLMLDALLGVDRDLLMQIVAMPHPSWLTAVMRAASVAGTFGAIWVAAGVVLFAAGTIRWRALVRLVVTIALVHLVVDATIKPWVDRPRPPLAIPGLAIGIDIPDSRSFPSGHAANAIAAAVVLGDIWRRGRAIVWPVAAVVAVTRVYLGVHYPLDAVAGSLIGLACGWATGPRAMRSAMSAFTKERR